MAFSDLISNIKGAAGKAADSIKVAAASPDDTLDTRAVANNVVNAVTETSRKAQELAAGAMTSMRALVSRAPDENTITATATPDARDVAAKLSQERQATIATMGNPLAREGSTYWRDMTGRTPGQQTEATASPAGALPPG